MSSKIKLNIAIGVAFVLVIVCIIWDWGTPEPIQAITLNPFNTDWSVANFNINSIIQTLLSALLGFLLSILIIEQVINKSREKEAEEKRDSRLLDIFSLLYIPFLEYSRAAICITNKIGDSNVYQCNIGKDALLDIYKPALYIDKPLYMPKIQFYIDAVEQLQATIKSVLLNADLSNNPKESKLLKDYLNDTYYFLSASKQLIVERKTNEKNLVWIGNVLDRPFDEIKTNNTAYLFVALAKLIKKHDDFFHELLPEQQYKDLFGIK